MEVGHTESKTLLFSLETDFTKSESSLEAPRGQIKAVSKVVRI